MKEYTFELVVFEGNDEFWENISNKSGCDEVREEITNALADHGFFVGDNCELTLKRYDS